MLQDTYVTGKRKLLKVTLCAGQGAEVHTVVRAHFLDNRLTDGGEFVSLICRPSFTSGLKSDQVLQWRHHICSTVLPIAYPETLNRREPMNLCSGETRPLNIQHELRNRGSPLLRRTRILWFSQVRG
jgi:hypothetical protein